MTAAETPVVDQTGRVAHLTDANDAIECGRQLNTKRFLSGDSDFYASQAAAQQSKPHPDTTKDPRLQGGSSRCNGLTWCAAVSACMRYSVYLLLLPRPVQPSDPGTS